MNYTGIIVVSLFKFLMLEDEDGCMEQKGLTAPFERWRAERAPRGSADNAHQTRF